MFIINIQVAFQKPVCKRFLRLDKMRINRIRTTMWHKKYNNNNNKTNKSRIDFVKFLTKNFAFKLICFPTSDNVSEKLTEEKRSQHYERLIWTVNRDHLQH